MNIFITGSGLVGCFSAAAFCKHGHNVVLFDKHPSRIYMRQVLKKKRVKFITGDIRDTSRLTSSLKQTKSDCLVHTAGVLRGIIDKDPMLGISINVLGTSSVILASAQASVKHIILCSSLSVYDYSKQNKPIAEDHLLKPTSIYDMTKLTSEMMASTLVSRYKLNLTILRLASVYGYGLFQGGAWLGRQLQTILEKLIAGEKAIIYERDFGINEYVYVKDVAQAILKSTNAPANESYILNIGSGSLISARDLFNQIKSLLPNAKIRLILEENINSLPNFLKRTQPFNLYKAKHFLGYNPKYDMKSGLVDYMEILERYQK